jgi:hypothetical protein
MWVEWTMASRSRYGRARMHKIYPHGPPEAFGPNLWQVRGTLAIPLIRKMVVHRLADGTLLLHSVVAMNDEGMRALEELGRPSVMVVPHPMHAMDAPFYAARFPGMKVVAPKDIAEKMAGTVKVDAAPEEASSSAPPSPHAGLWREPGQAFPKPF